MTLREAFFINKKFWINLSHSNKSDEIEMIVMQNADLP